MVIGFDAQPLFRNRDGVGTYTAELFKAAAKLHPEHRFVGVFFSNDSDDFKNEFDDFKNVTFYKVTIRWQIVRLFAEIGIWLPVDKILGLQFDGFVYTNFVSLPWISGKITKILIVHDAVYSHFPQTVSKPNLYYLRKFVKKSVGRKGVIPYSVSKHAAEDLSQLLGKKFKSAPPGPSVVSTVTTKGNHLLFIGTIEPRKNIDRLIKAYSRLGSDVRKKHPLYIAGKIGWNYEKSISSIKKEPGVKYLGFVSKKKREELMTSMYALVMPSLYEGFGIPVLDSVLLKKPVLTSSESPMSEVCGVGGAIYVHSDNEESIYEGLRKLTSLDDSEQKMMTDIAYKNSKQYSWEHTAEVIISRLGNP